MGVLVAKVPKVAFSAVLWHCLRPGGEQPGPVVKSWPAPGCQRLLLFFLFLSGWGLLGLPRWLSGEESTCQCRRHGFNPGARKNPGGRKLQPAPAFLSGKCRGQRSLPGYNPWGHKELVVTGWLSTQAQDLLSVSAVVGRVLSTLHFRLNHAHHLRRWYYDYTYWIDVETGACIGNWPVQSWGVSSARRQSPQCS